MQFKSLLALLALYSASLVRADDDDDEVVVTVAASSSASADSASASSSESTDSPSIVGTWSSKSNTVFTGPQFYDPVDELLIEPALPGISYSFTEDGFWEMALYQVTPDPRNHSCATAVLIFQHGTYTMDTDSGKLTMDPFEVDGRQLLSDPCNDDGDSMYSRYSQQMIFETYAVSVDGYHGRWKLQLYGWDGTPVQPLYLAYRPPEMLPTITMNPVDATESAGAASSGSAVASARNTASSAGLSEKVKRSLENRYKTTAYKKVPDFTVWWYASAGLMVLGTILIWKS
ncbi:unnamed protein product [Ambrosiozyma monospora]|uniref:Protein ROT1 n=1 Tax=Ambrosiozyma monospora TaxID=43982 RepID=A0A9W6YYV3_AMBMO|nr:unnamed protein product [Ambrosiozyma monospora]